MSISDVLSLFSGIALFLFGMSLMGDSLKKVAGNSLELILYKLSGSPLKGILLGTGVTAIIQSSSATSIMVVGFVNSGMMKLKQAISIIMGAIIGTSITGWIISLSSINPSAGGILSLLSTESITAIVAVIGIVMRMFSKHSKTKSIGDILLGFAVLMFGMSTMSKSVAGLRQSEVFINILTNFSNPLIGIVVGAAFTAVIQSASAAVGILQALSNTGAITFSIALPILMGIAIGASVPVILSSIGTSGDARRSAWSYLLIDLIGCAIVSLLYYGLNVFVHFSFAEAILNTFSIALVNTIFRVLMICLLAPFIDHLVLLMKKLIKDEDEEDLNEEDRLEEKFIKYPSVALEQVKMVINQMALITKDNVNRACSLLNEYDPKVFNKVNTKEDTIDRYADKLGTYLVKLTRQEMNEQQNAYATKYLQGIVDFERIGDHALNIAELAQKMYEDKVSFSFEGINEISNITWAIHDELEMGVASYMNDDVRLAGMIEPFEQLIDDLCSQMKENHVDRIRKGQCSLEHGIIYNDLLINFERISDHLENIAVEVLEVKEGNHDSHIIKKQHFVNDREEFDNLYNEYAGKYKL